MRRLTRRQRIAAVLLTFLALGFITLDLGGGSLKSAHTGVRGSFGALYRGTDSVLGPVRRFVQGVPSASSNQAKVDDLRRQNAELRGQLVQQQTDRATAAALDRLQLAANRGGYQVVPARVIALGAGEGFDWTITLDVGTSSGVRVGQTVTDGVGLVGRVLHADRSSCVVLLGADPGAGVGVRDTRNNELGIATGQGAQGYRFVPLDPLAKIEVGDELLTGPSGATSFVPGLSVGTVTEVRTSTDGIRTAQVSAATSPTRLALVGVILVGGSTPAREPLQPSSPNAQGTGR